MFRIGEYSKIARGSGRLLRYYDERGLFRPVHIDKASGYRYYSAEQLPQLNRILALKDLGLTLEQIARLVNEDVSVDEMRGMVIMKKAEIEQSLTDELRRMRSIEGRLEQIETAGFMPETEIVVKNLPAHRLLSLRTRISSLPEGFALFMEISQALPAQIGSAGLGQPVIVLHSELFDPEDNDVELGFTVASDFTGTATLPGERVLTVRDVAAYDTVATYVTNSTLEYGYRDYNLIGEWMERNAFGMAGPLREVIIELPDPSRDRLGVREIQIPVEPHAMPNSLSPFSSQKEF